MSQRVLAALFANAGCRLAAPMLVSYVSLLRRWHGMLRIVPNHLLTCMGAIENAGHTHICPSVNLSFFPSPSGRTLLYLDAILIHQTEAVNLDLHQIYVQWQKGRPLDTPVDCMQFFCHRYDIC
jgi:hypothetical protein